MIRLVSWKQLHVRRDESAQQVVKVSHLGREVIYVPRRLEICSLGRKNHHVILTPFFPDTTTTQITQMNLLLYPAPYFQMWRKTSVIFREFLEKTSTSKIGQENYLFSEKFFVVDFQHCQLQTHNYTECGCETETLVNMATKRWNRWWERDEQMVLPRR